MCIVRCGTETGDVSAYVRELKAFLQPATVGDLRILFDKIHQLFLSLTAGNFADPALISQPVMTSTFVSADGRIGVGGNSIDGVLSEVAERTASNAQAKFE